MDVHDALNEGDAAIEPDLKRSAALGCDFDKFEPPATLCCCTHKPKGGRETIRKEGAVDA